MTPAARAWLRAATPLAVLSVPSWAVLGLGSDAMVLPALCSSGLLWSVPAPETYAFFFTYVSPMALILGWAIMVAAMMVPTLLGPLGYLRLRTFAPLRVRAEVLALLGYAAVWMLAGVGLLGLALTLRLAAGDSLWPLTAALALALIWQASPWKQRALNLCHRQSPLAAFAPALWRDSLRLGLVAGGSCLASCWALMLTALLLPAYHLEAMIALSLWIWAERLDPPRPARWHLHLPRRALRLCRHHLRALRLTRTPDLSTDRS
ncbi:copper chaperone [Marinovum sp. KMM 9879]